METEKKSIIIGCLCAMFCEILYGMSYMFTKQATELASPFALLRWRFFVAAIFIVAFLSFGRIKLNLRGKT